MSSSHRFFIICSPQNTYLENLEQNEKVKFREGSKEKRLLETREKLKVRHFPRPLVVLRELSCSKSISSISLCPCVLLRNKRPSEGGRDLKGLIFQTS
jgi:hypothetical protein